MYTHQRDLSFIGNIMVTMMKNVMSPGFLLFAVLLVKGVQICVCTNSTFDWIEDERQTPHKLKQSFKDPPNRLVSYIYGAINKSFI